MSPLRGYCDVMDIVFYEDIRANAPIHGRTGNQESLSTLERDLGRGLNIPGY
ncbi:hypothetical protein [Microbacter margulisiae]|uniref:Uncharacterized protein n=1 Tax=Microbacter margulisiae TaxID=1350067 RepID=A0A7W5DSN0_9PORP|nr:hypothetical protein [Microbacter margulisiae]MBB3188351.1 hypothetical protein [Microbacter margulisiae]